MAAFSFRAVFEAGQPPRLEEISPDVPPGVYQVSGHDNTAEPGTPSEQKSVSVVWHDADGKMVVGGSGYVGA